MDATPKSMNAHELKTWLRNWVANASGLPVADIADDKPMEMFGLSSRDVVLLSGELENLLGVQLDATIAYEYPTIGALAERLVAGAPDKSAPLVRAHTPAAGDIADHDIAIVGMAARFPGAENLEAMWDLLSAGRSATGQLPMGRWSEYADDEVMTRRMAETNTTGGYLEDISSFDAEFFGLSPVEAANMDPQQRLTLEVAVEALEDAHQPANELRGTSVGVFVGSTNNDYGMLIAADPAEAHPYALTGTASSIIANRVSYALDFRGPSVNVDTACSSSLVAVHQAVRALRGGECDVALAGGVNIMSSPFVSTAFGELGVISPSGGIHAFSDDADGFVRSDGVGLVVLKRVRDAVANGDHIVAVIKGTAVNSDGRSNGLTAPNPEAQVDVLRRAYEDAGVDPHAVDYVEAHGTGTILGDPIEASALGTVLGRGRDLANPLLLGSAKTNFGHSESAAGAAGLIKVALGMKHGVLPPSLNYSGPNPYIDFDAEHLEVVEDPREWPEYAGKPTAGVSGFGFGGTNAHAVVQAFDPADYPQLAENIVDIAERVDELDHAAVQLPVSGLLPSRRKQSAKALADYLESLPTQDDETRDLEQLAKVSRSLARRNHGRSRAVVTARTTADAVRLLGLVAEGKKAAGIEVADSPMKPGPVFVYSGFGSQHRKMAKDLIADSAFFEQRMRELDDIVTFESGWSILELIEDDAQTYDTETAQVAITAIQIAVTDLLAHLGITPAAVMGMSMGEIAAGYASGGLSAYDAMIIACHRSRLMGEGEKSLAEDQLGAMALVEFAADDLANFVKENSEYAGIEPAVYAGPGMTTVGGPREQVTQLVEKLEGEGKFARLLNVKGAGHTSAVDPLLGELAAEMSLIEPQPLRIPLFSSVHQGRVYSPGQTVHTADYFLHCTRYPVYFQDATTQAFAAGHTMLVEISPNPVALMPMMNTAFATGNGDAQLLFALKRKVAASDSMRDLMAKMYVAGQPVKFPHHGDMLFGPDVQWKHQRYWTAARPSSGNNELPGHKVTLPDGSVAFSTHADLVPSSQLLVESAAQAVNPNLTVALCDQRSSLPPSGELTTVVRPHLGGATITVHRIMGEQTVLIAEGYAAATDLLSGIFGEPAAGATGAAGVAGAAMAAGFGPETDDAVAGEEDLEVETIRWDPEKETVEQRLRAIVSESMGFDVEDLPGELPLIDLGLDSLMGMRIKNRIEHDFQIPPLQVQALRDASVADVVTIVEDLVAHRGTGADEAATATAAAEAAPAEAAAPAPETADEKASDDGAQGVGVAPRDASERLVFATWATITGKAANGVTSELPTLSEEDAQAMAERLSERSGAEITAEDITSAAALEDIANKVREGLETEVEGNIRVLRARPEGSTKPAVFFFHPAGGSSVVYQPLMRRLPEDVPVYGVERLEGPLPERAAAYLDEIKQYSDGLPIILGGWSFGGALAYEVAHQLVGTDVEVAHIALLDTVQPSELVPDTPEETRARWERYSAFAKKTYGLDFPVPYELLETAGEDAMLQMMADFLANTDASEHGLSAGVLEHQRASFVDNRILDKVDLANWADVNVPVTLFRAERMHDGAIELEPRYASIDPDGGWSAIVKDLDIVQLNGDHLAIVDEPEIGKVGAYLTRRINNLGG
ncbi:polyketide synthase Pks13 [Corynebacterium aquilae]|uniref:Polyketide synthase n=1 Tax=Corynebacterium aquilae DSM 44791 TaxID=1431546 RepID=A0A1L7CIC3_9CORY|nr:polyketide synthase Pks13 [Corynebacterium aquilae]APT85616.1 polyketide synthase [Corynebacterium aquilae DSM 44791]